MHVSAPAISGSLQAPGSKSAGHLVLLCNIRKKVCVCVCGRVKGWERRADVRRSSTMSEIGSMLVSYSHHSTLQGWNK